MNISDITPEYLRRNGINPEGLLFSPFHLPYNPRLKAFSRKLRNNGEISESLLWENLKSKQTGYSFARQKPILNILPTFIARSFHWLWKLTGILISHGRRMIMIVKEIIDKCKLLD